MLGRGSVAEGPKGRGLRCPRTDALLLSYVRTTAPEFDLIFSRKEIKRKWPTRESDDECNGLILLETP